MDNPRRPVRPGGDDVGIADKVAYLSTAEAWPEPAGRVDVVQTHMSWVFLTERYAYKLKKPVRYDFLDFRSLEARRLDCREEVRLNCRLAPRVYLGVVPLTVRGGGGLRVGGTGTVVDWMVMMRRLPTDRMLDRAVAAGRVRPRDVDEAARLLADFYRNAEPVPTDPAAYRARLQAEIEESRRHLGDAAYGLPGALVGSACAAQSDFLRRQGELLETRAREGRIVEAHGDLRPEHVCLGPPPQIIDCLEFKREFRILDCADELSFLWLECERLGAPQLGERFFRVYRERTGDAPRPALVHFYKSLRASLRAKLAAWHLRDGDVSQPSKWTGLARAYLDLAAEHAARAG